MITAMLNAMRIGHGFDVHAFDTQASPGTYGIVLGGVTIPHPYSLKAHSDGDVLLHALCDALLGAAALGDIGHHFPDTDPAYQNADSRDLLRHVAALVNRQKLTIANIDATVIAQAPKLAPHINAMRTTIAADLDVLLNQVNIKATTTERLGYIGRGEGIAVHVVTLLGPS